jgi:hypothetical protein
MTVTEPNSPEGDASREITILITAASALLMRSCLGRTEPGDAEAGRTLTRRLLEVGAPHEILAVATGGVWAAFRPPGELDPETNENIAEVARLFLETGGFDGLVALSSACLTLMAQRGLTSTPGADLVVAARAAWELEHHELALAASRDAVLRPELSKQDGATVRDLIRRITNSADSNPPRSVLRASDEPGHSDSDIGTEASLAGANWDAARQAVTAGDRAAAARHLAHATAELKKQSQRDHEHLDGLARAFAAMSGDKVDVPELREGLTVVVRHLRIRQRFGNVPPAVRAALELTVLVLTCTPSEATGSVLSELLEALADAGLSEVTIGEATLTSPAEVEAQLIEDATAFPLWPDLDKCVSGLEGNFALLTRRIGGGVSSRERWISLFVVPPDGVLIKSGQLPTEQADLMHNLARGDWNAVKGTRHQDVEALLASFVHTDALELLRRQPKRGLVIVPDGEQWSVPWNAAPLLTSRPTSLSPSLGFYRRLNPLIERVKSIVALVDDTVHGADELIDELLTARNTGTLAVDFAPDGLAREADLLLVLAHGLGDGLRFQVGLPHATLDALSIARLSRSRSAVIASCWSAKAPPVAMPLNLSVSLLHRGASMCLGGAWPLPQRATAEMLSDTVRSLAEGQALSVAIADARGEGSLIGERWGLIASGRIPAWRGDKS